MAYPTPLQCSGTLTMNEIRDWMIAAGELSSTSQVSLAQLVAASHLTDKTAPFQISDFYCYELASIPCNSSFSYSGDNGSTYAKNVDVGEVSGNIPINYTVYNTTGGSSQQYLNVDVQYENGAWYSLAAGLPIPIGGSISGTLNYPFAYNTSTIIKVILQKST